MDDGKSLTYFGITSFNQFAISGVLFNKSQPESFANASALKPSVFDPFLTGNINLPGLSSTALNNFLSTQ